MVLDGQNGLVPGDLDIVSQLRASGAPILAVVNKIDAKKAREAAMQFYELGIDPMFEISAQHGLGISESARRSRAAAAEVLRPHRRQPTRRRHRAIQTPKEVSIAIIGRPNACKSSLVKSAAP